MAGKQPHKPGKTVWLINHYIHLPDETSGLTRHFELATRLKTHGWDMCLIAASTQHPSGENRMRFWQRSRLEIRDGVKILWIPTTRYKSNGIDRVINMALFSMRVRLFTWRKMLPQPSIIIGSSPHPFAAYAASSLAKKINSKFIFEIRDLWPMALTDMKRIKAGSVLDRLLGKGEKRLFDRADAIISLWPHVDDYAREKGLRLRQYTWVSNGADMGVFERIEKREESGQPFTLLYFGAHGGANDLQTSIKAMAIVRKKYGAEKMVLRLVGNGPAKPDLMKLAHELEADNVVFQPSVAKRDVPDLASSADALVFTLRNLDMFRYGISPNKLFEYMASGRPIAMACTARGNPVELSRGGLVGPAGDAAQLAANIISLYEMTPSQRAHIADLARAYCKEKFDWAYLAERFSNAMENALEDTGESPD